VADVPVAENRLVEDRLVSSEVEGVQNELLVVVAVPNVVSAVGQNGSPVEWLYAFLVVGDQCAFWEDPSASLEVDQSELFEAAARCSVVGLRVSSVGLILIAVGVHCVGPSAPAEFQLYQLDVTTVLTEPAGQLGVPSVVAHLSGDAPGSD